MTKAEDLIPLIDWSRFLTVAIGDRADRYVLAVFFKNPYHKSDYGSFRHDGEGYRIALEIRRELHEHVRILERLRGVA